MVLPFWSSTTQQVPAGPPVNAWGWYSANSTGATRMLRTADGWWALSLARESDLDLVPALLEDAPGDDR